MSKTSEIVERLREGVPFEPRGTFSGKLMFEAAARLETLERENARLQKEREKERDYAVKWGNQSLDSVKEVMWRYEDALNLIGNSLVCAPTDYAEHNASELLRAGNIARAALAGSDEK